MSRGAQHQAAKVVVNESIEDDPPDLPAGHSAPVFEEPELMRKGRHAHAQHQGDVADAQLPLAERKDVDDARPGWVRERPEQISDGAGAVRTEGATEQRVDAIGVPALDRALVGVDRRGEQLSHRSTVAGAPGEQQAADCLWHWCAG